MVGTCNNCKTETTVHLHHIVPRALGGTDSPGNLVELCEACHGKIHNRSMTSHSELTRRGLERAKSLGKQVGGARKGAGRKRKRYDSELVAKVRRLLAEGKTQAVTAEMLGLSVSTVQRIKRRNA